MWKAIKSTVEILLLCAFSFAVAFINSVVFWGVVFWGVAYEAASFVVRTT